MDTGFHFPRVSTFSDATRGNGGSSKSAAVLVHPPLPVFLLPRRIAIGRFGGTIIDVAVVAGLVPRRADIGFCTVGGTSQHAERLERSGAGRRTQGQCRAGPSSKGVSRLLP